MTVRGFNWPIWAAPLLGLATLFSYPLFFVRWPATRDVPWVNLLLLVATLAALTAGVRRATAPNRGWLSRVSAIAIGLLTVATLGRFVYGVFISARHLPASTGAPAVGRKAPEFTLLDQYNIPVSLASMLSTPLQPGSTPPRALLLIFYRGYW
jgi:hypothetical protein